MTITNTLPLDGGRLLQIAGDTGLRHHLQGIAPADTRELLARFTAAVFAAEPSLAISPSAEPGKPSAVLTMTVAQVRQLLNLSAGDDVSDDAENEVSLCRGNGADGNGLYFWATDYPDEGATLLDGVEHCSTPPIGWRCTRQAGHAGPCAAVEAPEDLAFVERAMQRLRDGAPQSSRDPATLALEGVPSRVGAVRDQALQEAAAKMDARYNAVTGKHQYDKGRRDAYDVAESDILALKGTPAAAVADAQPVADEREACAALLESRAQSLFRGGIDYRAVEANHCAYVIRHMRPPLAAQPWAKAQPFSNPGPLAAALRIAEAALSDIGDAAREPGDDVAWCERRAAQALPAVRAAIAAVEPFGNAGELDTSRLDALGAASWGLVPENVSTGGDDYDIAWKVVSYHMNKPHEREVAFVVDDDPRAAIDAAIAASKEGASHA